jgi:hypothetical protein
VFGVPANVLFKYALALDRKRRDLFRKYPDTELVKKALIAANIMPPKAFQRPE